MDLLRRPDSTAMNAHDSISRRQLLTGLGVASAGALLATPSGATSGATAARAAGIKAVAFDAFAIFDPRPIAAACEQAFPGRGVELISSWRTRQFEYQWLRALGGQYRDFWATTRAALDFACASLKLELSAGTRDALMRQYRELAAWPEVPAALRELKNRGLKLSLLSNATVEILEAGIEHSNLRGLFDLVISTDRIRSFKPEPRAYQLGVDAHGIPREEILFVASAGWDAAGAKWFGYRTFWNNRGHLPAEELGATPDGAGPTLDGLTRFIDDRKKLGWPMGLEPTTAEITTRGSTN